MSITTLRYYKNTFAYLPSRYDQRAREAGKFLRTKISRRKAKQMLRNIANKQYAPISE